MPLNIKDPEAHELAQALAQETGETMTLAVIQALRERLERVQRTRRVASAEELLAIGRRCAQGNSAPVVAHGDLLYDEQGLPR
jgi:antitoxin VapB